MRRSTLLHLRVPLGMFLLPVYLFALADGPLPVEAWRAGLLFVCLHLFLYPASNGFNSFYDKDEGPIGGLASPPPTGRELLYVSLGLDVTAWLMGLPFGWGAAGLLFSYGLASKLYSHEAVRLKKYPWTSWLVTSFFQGCVIYLLCQMSLRDIPFRELMSGRHLLPALLSSLMIAGFYPLTQVYQHAEDARRGDMTLSRLLGVRGTFYFCAGIWAAGGGGFLYFFEKYYSSYLWLALGASLTPALIYTAFWFLRIRRDPNEAAYRPMARLSLLASGGVILFFAAMVAAGWRA